MTYSKKLRGFVRQLKDKMVRGTLGKQFKHQKEIEEALFRGRNKTAKKKCGTGRTVSTAYRNLTGKPLVRFKKLTKSLLIDEKGKRFTVKGRKRIVVCKP